MECRNEIGVSHTISPKFHSWQGAVSTTNAVANYTEKTVIERPHTNSHQNGEKKKYGPKKPREIISTPLVVFSFRKKRTHLKTRTDPKK